MKLGPDIVLDSGASGSLVESLRETRYLTVVVGYLLQKFN